MSSPQLFTIVDDSFNNSFVLGPRDWKSTNLPQWFNSTLQSPAFALDQGSPLGTVKMKFEGTSIAFYGNTPRGVSSQTFCVSIDGGTTYNTTYADSNPPSYRQWYQSPLLDEGAHDIMLSNIAGDTSVDFAVVTAGEDTPLNGTTIITDNDDTGFNYTGRWTRSQDAFNSGPQLDGNPYHNSTHRASDVGSFLTYAFNGNSAAIYGIFNWLNLGLLSLTITLDGQSLIQTYAVLPDSPQFISQLGQQPNFLFYEYSFLQAGNHTLTVNLTECVNQTFVFDYFTFGPSFATLANMPKLVPIKTDDAQSTISKNSHTGIITASLGAAGIVLLICAIIFFLGRRKVKGGKYEIVHPFQRERHSQRLVAMDSYCSPGSTPIYRMPMNVRQPASALNYRLDNEIVKHSLPARPLLSGDIRAPLHSINASGITDLRPLLGSAHAQPNVFRPRDMGGESRETLPPSYDETTRGQLPLQATYFI